MCQGVCYPGNQVWHIEKGCFPYLHSPSCCRKCEGYHLRNYVLSHCLLCQCLLPSLTCQGDMEHLQPPTMFTAGHWIPMQPLDSILPYRLRVRSLFQEMERLAFIARLWSAGISTGRATYLTAGISTGRATY